MVLRHGIEITDGVVQATPLPRPSTVIGVIGSVTGVFAAEQGIPVAVNNVADAETEFGASGGLVRETVDVARDFANVWVVGSIFVEPPTGAASTLSADISDSVTDVPVVDSAEFLVEDVILIGAERMLVTGINPTTNTLTVVRGHDSTVAASALSGADVTIQRFPRIFNAIDAMIQAEARTGRRPDILIAPGLTFMEGDGGIVNVVMARLRVVANRIGAFVVGDCAYTGRSRFTDAEMWGENNGYQGVLGIPQTWNSSTQTNLPGSILAAAIMAQQDALHVDEVLGIARPLSNIYAPGVVAVNPVLSFDYSDPSTDAQTLEAAGLTSIVNDEGVFKFWGGISRADPADSARRYMGVQRANLFIRRRMHRLARPFLGPVIREETAIRIAARITTGLRRYVPEVIASALVIPDAERNTDEVLRGGQVYMATSNRYYAPTRIITLEDTILI